MSAAFDPAERVRVASIRKNTREEIRVELLRMQDGRWRASARVFFRDGDDWRPARDGFTLHIEALTEFAGAVTAAVGEARDRGLLE